MRAAESPVLFAPRGFQLCYSYDFSPYLLLAPFCCRHVVRVGGVTLNTFRFPSFRGFAARVPAGARVSFLQRLVDDPRVERIEDNLVMRLAFTQDSPPWGVDRIDQVLSLRDTGYNTYNYTSTGAGVRAFVIDTGIRTDHTEFTGRLLPGATFIAGTVSANDDNGHGEASWGHGLTDRQTDTVTLTGVTGRDPGC